jgi:DNA-binding LytR/AlgR family response regulator
MLTALIIDNDPHEARRLALVLRQVALFSTVRLARDAREGAELIGTLAPDIAFVDVGANSPGVGAALSESGRTSVVLLTVEDDLGVAALRARDEDHVLKPVACRAVLDVVARVRARRQLVVQAPAVSRDQYDDSIWISGRRGLARVMLRAVEAFEAERDYVRVWTEGLPQLMRGPLQTLGQRLDPLRFVRIHRSAIVNLDHMAEMRRAPNGRMRLRLLSGRELTVSANYAKAVRDLVRGPAVSKAITTPVPGPFAVFQR